jgi:hypothetical protein
MALLHFAIFYLLLLSFSLLEEIFKATTSVALVKLNADIPLLPFMRLS